MTTTIKKNYELLPKSEESIFDPKIFIIHENSDWVIPLRDALTKLSLPYEEWYVNEGAIDLNQIPPHGVFYNRMSASSHTRGHRYAVELTGPLLAWLEAHGRRVVNNRRALQLEVRKFEQYLSLNRFGIKTPKTIAAVGLNQILEAAEKFKSEPFILKPNRGGKGLDVRLFQSHKELEELLRNDPVISLDGVALVQQYIKPKDSSIIRLEFIGGKFYYAVRVDTSDGFELCPADVCQVGDAFCPTENEGKSNVQKAKFEVLEDYQNPDIPKYEEFLAANGMEVAALECVENTEGERFIYDVNVNTNYNNDAEVAAGNQRKGMQHIAEFLGKELEKLSVRAGKILEKAGF